MASYLPEWYKEWLVSQQQERLLEIREERVATTAEANEAAEDAYFGELRAKELDAIERGARGPWEDG